ncbi:Global transcriptional regulator, cell division control protein, partial [Pseudoloma neurophilia]
FFTFFLIFFTIQHTTQKIINFKIPLEMSDLKLAEQQFKRRLSKIQSKIEIPLLTILGKKSDMIEIESNNALFIYLTNYEFPETLFLITKENCFAVTSTKKKEVLETLNCKNLIIFERNKDGSLDGQIIKELRKITNTVFLCDRTKLQGNFCSKFISIFQIRDFLIGNLFIEKEKEEIENLKLGSLILIRLMIETIKMIKRNEQNIENKIVRLLDNSNFIMSSNGGGCNSGGCGNGNEGKGGSSTCNGNNTCNGDNGNNTCNGDNGNNTCNGDNGNNTCNGNNGNNDSNTTTNNNTTSHNTNNTTSHSLQFKKIDFSNLEFISQPEITRDRECVTINIGIRYFSYCAKIRRILFYDEENLQIYKKRIENIKNENFEELKSIGLLPIEGNREKEEQGVFLLQTRHDGHELIDMISYENGKYTLLTDDIQDYSD